MIFWVLVSYTLKIFLFSIWVSENTSLAISSGLLADAVWQTWPLATGFLQKAVFLQKCLKRENLKFIFVIWESILRDQTEFKSVLFSVPQMLAMMVDLEEDEDWANADELADDDFDR